MIYLRWCSWFNFLTLWARDEKDNQDIAQTVNQIISPTLNTISNHWI